MKLNESLGYLLNLTARNMKHELNERLKKYNLTTSQWALLKLLLENGEMSQIKIAENTHSDKATTGTVIDKLIKKGLVIRKRSEKDKRVYNVQISDEGKDLLNKSTEYAINTNDKALQGFNEEDIKKLFNYLKIINSNLGDE